MRLKCGDGPDRKMDGRNEYYAVRRIRRVVSDTHKHSTQYLMIISQSLN